jgi:hypothetical protein
VVQQHPGLYYAPSGKHRYGMFCLADIEADSVIEVCPIILMPADQAAAVVKGHILYDYYFEWKKDQIAIALGYGSLYNHSAAPNAHFEPDYRNQLILFRADEFIPAGQEILVDYHAGTPGVPLWFDVI